MSHKTVLIYSGGLDSTCLLSELLKEGDEVHLLNFNYGSKHNDVEREAAKKVAAHYGLHLHEIELPFINKLFKSDLLQSGGEIPEGHYAAPNMKQTVVPGRNTIMLSIAIGYADSIDADRVALGNHSGDHAIYPDCRPEWAHAMSLAAFHGTFNNIQLYAPFTSIDKGDVCKVGHDNGAPLHLTWTCYKGNEGAHCGRCGSCVERKEAFEKHGVKDPTKYDGSLTKEELETGM
jgi:7-cyano-7-deazaguanine synthase